MMAEWIKLQWEFGKRVPDEVTAAAHRTITKPKPLWLFQANRDFTESQLTEYKVEVGNDVDGKAYVFRHVFEADDWDAAKLQIARLRFGADD